MTMQAHLESLEKKHGALEEKLHTALTSPSIDDHQIAGVQTDVRHRVSDGPDEIGRVAPANTILVEVQF